MSGQTGNTIRLKYSVKVMGASKRNEDWLPMLLLRKNATHTVAGDAIKARDIEDAYRELAAHYYQRFNLYRHVSVELKILKAEVI